MRCWSLRNGSVSFWFALQEMYNWHADPEASFNPLMNTIELHVSAAINKFVERIDYLVTARRGQSVLLNAGFSYFVHYSRTWRDMDQAERAQWRVEILPRKLRHIFPTPAWRTVMWEHGYARQREPSDLVERCRIWHMRVKCKRERDRPQHIVDMLELAALHLRVLNRDVLERILLLAREELMEPVLYV